MWERRGASIRMRMGYRKISLYLRLSVLVKTGNVC